MPTFKYKARDAHGKSVTGVIEKKDESDVARHFKQMGYVATQIDMADVQKGGAPLLSFVGRVQPSDLNLFTRQLATLQKSGLPLLRSLEALEVQTENVRLKSIISGVRVRVEGGASLSQALSHYPGVFEELYCAMVRAGESGGVLDKALLHLAELGEYDQETRDKIKQAIRYPALVVVALMLSVTIILTFVVPQFQRLFDRFGADLPLPTKILITSSQIVLNYWWAILIGCAAVGFGLKLFRGTRVGRRMLDGLMLKLPILGPLMQKIIMSRFSKTSAILMRTGLPILETLKLASHTAVNRVVQDSIDSIRMSVNEGKGISEPMKVSRVFPPMVYHMVALGEESGQLDELLLRVSEYYDQQSDYVIKNMTTLIEPILIFGLGIIVLFMALAIFLPMWRLSGLFIGR